MTTLSDFASAQAGVTLATDTEKRLITITGGLLRVNAPLTGDYSGWRILCTSSGGIAFDYPDQSAQTGLIPSAEFSSALCLFLLGYGFRQIRARRLAFFLEYRRIYGNRYVFDVLCRENLLEWDPAAFELRRRARGLFE